MLLRKAHCCQRTGRLRIGEVTVTVWPKQLHDVCEKHYIQAFGQRQYFRFDDGPREPLIAKLYAI